MNNFFQEIAQDFIGSLVVNYLQNLLKKIFSNHHKKSNKKQDIYFFKLIDFYTIVAQEIFDFYSGHFNNNLKDASILLLAVQICHSKPLFIKNADILLKPNNKQIKLEPQLYKSQSLLYKEKYSNTVCKIPIDTENYLFSNSTIGIEPQTFIFPIIIKNNANANIGNFESISLQFADAENITYVAKIIPKETILENKSYIKNLFNL